VLLDEAEEIGGDLWLQAEGKHVHWTIGGRMITLEGQFTAQELRELATHMEAHKPN
jgi:hypothetical protein